MSYAVVYTVAKGACTHDVLRECLNLLHMDVGVLLDGEVKFSNRIYLQ